MGGFGQGSFGGGTFGEPLGAAGAGLARLLGFLPRWLQGPRARDVAAAVGQQLDDFDARAFGDQLFVETATWGLAVDVTGADGSRTATGWEADYAIPTLTGDSYEARRARVRARRRAHGLRTLADFVAFVRATLVPAATADPTAYVTLGRYVVFKPRDRGWPNFADVEAALALAAPAHLGAWLAPHREAPDTGLLDWQLDLLHGEAIDVLTDAEIDGL